MRGMVTGVPHVRLSEVISSLPGGVAPDVQPRANALSAPNRSDQHSLETLLVLTSYINLRPPDSMV